jgi:hypothetical protein
MNLLLPSGREAKMLKRYQVLLPDWMEDYIKFLVERYDLSFSEIIRAQLCFSFLNTIIKLCPEYKPGITTENIVASVRLDVRDDLKREDLHKLFSKMYFETRKAVEYRLDKEKKPKKK